MTLDEFLAWEEPEELRREFDSAVPVATIGGSRAQADVQGNLAAALRPRLRGTPCRFYGVDHKVLVPGAVRNPDGFVVCTPGAGGDTDVEAPVVIFKVLSGSAQDVGRTEEAREYRATPSVQRYVMLERTRVAATMHARYGERWLGVLLFEGDTLSMPEIGIKLPLAELYEGVELPRLDRRDDQGTPLAAPRRGAGAA